MLAAEGYDNRIPVENVSLSLQMICKWRQRYIEKGLMGSHDELRRKWSSPISDEVIADVIHRILKTQPKDATYRTIRSPAKETEFTKPTVHRIWTVFGLQPHRLKSFKLSTDPFFVEKVCDIVGLYLNPPDKAMIRCVNEKSQIQAPNRTQPLLPMGLDSVEGVTHDYIRHGATTLFAASNIATREVMTTCKRRHRCQEYRDFFKRKDTNVPPELEIRYGSGQLFPIQKHPKSEKVAFRTSLLQCPLPRQIRIVAKQSKDLLWHHYPASYSARGLQKF